MRIAIRTDASANIGTGHLSRCLTLANKLRSSGWQTRFICRDLAPVFSEQIVSQGHELEILSTPTHAQPDNDGLAHSHWLPVSQDTDATQTLKALGARYWDWMISDHYALDHRWQTQVRAAAKHIFVIDDLADRKHDCSILLDQNLTDPRIDRYAGLTKSGCRKLIGVSYALLRPEFADAEKMVRASSSNPRLNVLFGGTDPQGGTELALQAIAMLETEVATDVIVGIGNPRLDVIRKICEQLPGATLHVQSNNIAALFAAADLGIGAGGASSWERCRLGLPTLVTSMATNQRRACASLAEARVAMDLGEMGQLTARTLSNTIEDLLARPRLLALMSRRAAALVDGNGTQRVCEHITNMTGTERTP